MVKISDGERAGRRAWAVIALAALACVAASPGSHFDAAALRRQLRAAGFSDLQARTALSTVEDAAARGLPASALLNRLREGLARHAEPAAILHVLTDRETAFARANELAQRLARDGVSARDREGSLARLADALSLGVGQQDVVNLLPVASTPRDLESVSRAAEVSGRLLQRGFPPADTRDVLKAALGAGWTRSQTDGLVDLYLEARRLGVARDLARQALAEGIRAGNGPDRLMLAVRQSARADAASPATSPTHSSSAASPSGGGAGKGTRGGSSRGPSGGRGTPSRAPGPRQSGPRPPAPRMPPAHR